MRTLRTDEHAVQFTEEQEKVDSRAIYYALLFTTASKLLFDPSWTTTLGVFIVAVGTQWDSTISLRDQMHPNNPIERILTPFVGERLSNILHKTEIVSELPFRLFSRAIHQLPILPEDDKLILKNFFLDR